MRRRSRRRRRQRQKPLRIRRWLLRFSRRRQVSLNTPKLGSALVKDGVDAAQEHTAQDIEVLTAARLDADVGCAVPEVLESEVRGLDVEEGVADGESNSGQD